MGQMLPVWAGQHRQWPGPKFSFPKHSGTGPQWGQQARPAHPALAHLHSTVPVHREDSRSPRSQQHHSRGHQGASGCNQPRPCPLHPSPVHLPQPAAAPLMPFLGALREDTHPSTAVHYISARLDPTTSEPSLEDHFSSSQCYLFSAVPGNNRYHTTTNPERKECCAHVPHRQEAHKDLEGRVILLCTGANPTFLMHPEVPYFRVPGPQQL